MYSRKSVTKQNIILLILDCISIFISVNISMIIRLKIDSFDFGFEYRDVFSLVVLFGFAYFLQIVIFNFNKEFRNNGILKEFLTTLKMNIFLAVVVTFLMYGLRVIRLDFSRLVFVLLLLINIFLMFALHRVYYEILKKTTIKGFKRRQLVIVTSRNQAENLINVTFPEEAFEYNISAIALLDREQFLNEAEINGIPIISAENDLVQFCVSQVVDEVFIKAPDYQLGEIYSAINNIVSMGITIHLNVELFGVDIAAKKTFTSIGDTYAVTFANNFMSFRQRFVKRMADIIGGLLGSIIAIVFMIIFGIAINIESPGPILFKQKRVGRNGRFFYMYKLRSMYPDAEARKAELMKDNDMNGLMFKMENDPRITRVGRFLRRTSIDEFPQFFNVLKGDMSLVGTRPPTMDEFEHYKSHHKMRLSIKPGITGMWQVSGRSKITEFEDVVKLDVWYINNYTLGLDVKILFKTISSVLKKEGAE